MKKEKKELSFLDHLYVALLTTAYTHPLRGLLNNAANSTNPIDTWIQSWRLLHRGFALNVVRGGTAVALQSYTNKKVTSTLGKDTPEGKFFGMLAPAFMGTGVALAVEIPYFRYSTLPGKDFAFTRLNGPLALFLLIREAGFSSAVLCTDGLPTDEPKYWAIMGGATFVSALAHKLSVCEATADVTPKGQSPNFGQEGVIKTVRNIMQGKGNYTNKAWRPRYAHATKAWQQAANMIWLCGPNMLMMRAMFLTAYTLMFRYNKESLDDNPKQEGMFKDLIRRKASASKQVEEGPVVPNKQGIEGPAGG